MNTKLAAIILGVVFILVGVLGFIPNPLVSPDGLFAVNTMHNVVHLVTGAGLLAGAYTAFGSAMALKVFGGIYALVAILGLILGPGLLLGLVLINAADNWLHVALAAAILAAGFALPEEPAT